MAVHAFTSCSFSYLNRARVLGETLRALHPDWTLWLVMTDKPPSTFQWSIANEDWDYCVTAEDLFGKDTDTWLFGMDIVEACTAVKGRACAHILARADCEKLFYFDPDIALLNSMDEVVDILDDYDIVLTPHQIEPEDRIDLRAIRDNEVTSLHYGVFNLGFVALSQGREARRFVDWWDDRLLDWCHDRLDIGLFVDQKWCDLVPCFFEKVKVLRDPGYNVASWNLSKRKMSFDDKGVALINDRPLRFYHFTKLGAVGDTMTQRYAGRNFEVYELWQWYKRSVQRHSDSSIPKGWWHYGSFSNGVKIPKRARELYRTRKDLIERFPDPFNAEMDSSLFDWLMRETEIFNDTETRGFQPV